MKLAKFAAILALPLVASGCQAMIWGQVTALAASVFIFAGTLALGRSSELREGGAASSKPD